LNDPFEYVVDIRFDSSPETIARNLRRAQERTGQRQLIDETIADSRSITGQIMMQRGFSNHTKQWGTCSFTSDVCDAEMWAYYGEGHTGIAVVYNSTPEVVGDVLEAEPMPLFPLKVEYKDEPAVLHYWEAQPNVVAQSTVGRKSRNWEHEKEWRFVGEDGGGLRSVNRKEFIDGIALGLKANPETRQRMLDFAASHGLESYKMVMESPAKSYRLKMVPVK
jgi:hypothetical protein